MQNKEFLDEKIVEMINQSESVMIQSESEALQELVQPQEIEQSIYTGIKIQGQWIEFEERLFVDDKITMMVPLEFENMDVEEAKQKYPMEQRPETILTDSTGTINILLRYMGDPISNEDTEMIRDELLTIMCRMNPGIKTQSTDVKVVSGKNIAYVEFTNPVMDGKLYNLMYFLEVEGKTLMGSFNCSAKSAKHWKSSAYEMMQSIRLADEASEV